MREGKIRILPDRVRNMIAAGEVVERPASVVKELVENSIDAGSSRITIDVQGGGIRRITVSDDGCGMVRSDAIMAFERHATSKIREEEDLRAIRTFGFRGEALPSIAAVSKIRMLTRTRDSMVGTEVVIEGGKIKGVRDAGCPPGTIIEVSNLFFNTPARLKSLRSPFVESGLITATVIRMALPYIDISFKLIQDGKEILTLPRCSSLKERISEIFGIGISEGLVPISYDGYSHIEGFAGRPTLTKSGQDYIYTFVNGRFVRNRTILRSISSAYEGLIPQDRSPVVFIFIELDPSKIDVNVHPTKIDLRFDDERALYSEILEAIRSSILHPTPIRDVAPKMDLRDLPEPERLRLKVQPPPPPPEEVGGVGYRIIGQLHNLYLLIEVEDGLLILDQHAAHERLIYEKLLSSEMWNKGQPLLVPIPLELDSARAQILLSISESLSNMGFEIERFGGTSFVVRSIPAVLESSDVLDSIDEILSEAMEGVKERDGERFKERICSILACKAAMKAGRRLEPKEVEEMIKLLERGPASNTCPHGRPISLKISRSDLDKRFRR